LPSLERSAMYALMTVSASSMSTDSKRRCRTTAENSSPLVGVRVITMRDTIFSASPMASLALSFLMSLSRYLSISSDSSLNTESLLKLVRTTTTFLQDAATSVRVCRNTIVCLARLLPLTSTVTALAKYSASSSMSIRQRSSPKRLRRAISSGANISRSSSSTF